MPSKDQGSRDPSGYDKSADVNALREELREEIRALQQAVSRVALANTIENSIENGFDRIVTQLQPLRDLTAQRKLLNEAGYATLRNLRAALARPKWKSSKFEIDTIDKQSESNQPRSIGS